MKLINILFSFFICFFTSNVFSQNIAVINIQSLIDNNYKYNEMIKEMELNQKKFLNKFDLREEELKFLLNDIEESKLILSEKEINAKINDYNNQLSDFTIKVDDFNFHYQNQIIILRESVLKEIIILIEKYAIENDIDLILDSNSYLIASNSLDITNLINIELEKINFKLEYKSFENY